MRKLVTVMAGAVLAFGISSVADAAEIDKKIERTWKAKCASCHGATGKADTEQGRKMKVSDYTTAAFQKKFTDAQLKDLIIKGVNKEADGVKKEMDGYADLPAETVDGLVALIRSFGK